MILFSQKPEPQISHEHHIGTLWIVRPINVLPNDRSFFADHPPLPPAEPLVSNRAALKDKVLPFWEAPADV